MRSALLAACLLTALPAAATPWLEPGDRQVRGDVELLAAAGLLRGPVNAWPLPWAQVGPALRDAAGQPPHVAAAIRRLERLRDIAGRTSRYEARIAATNEPMLVRDFGGGAREEFDASVRGEHDIGALSITYGIGFRDGQQGDDVHFEPTSAALSLGNWALYAGYVETWWGPGHDGALLFSTNARPTPKIGIKRLSPEPFDLPVLEWLGPWRLDIFAGLLENDRRDFRRPAVIGIRAAFEPARGLEIGLNRGLQLCGENRPCGFDTISDALIGFGDADNTGTFDEPGNQLAGFDISYTHMIGRVALKAYVEAEAEDEDNVLVDQFARLGGITLAGPLGDAGASWTARVEYADTLAIKAFGSRRYPGSFYDNFIYSDGFSYRRRVLGHNIDGDSELLTVAATLTDSADRRFYGSLRFADLNRTSSGNNRLTATRETVNIATAGVELPTSVGELRVEARLQDDQPNTPNRTPRQGQVEIGLRTRF